jgi:hypothetical protein
MMKNFFRLFAVQVIERKIKDKIMTSLANELERQVMVKNIEKN